MTENSTEQSDSETTDYRHFKPGDKVRTIFGEVRTGVGAAWLPSVRGRRNG